MARRAEFGMDDGYKAQIDTYYGECIRDYEIVWQLKDSLALHYGYWDEHTLTHRQALWNMNDQLARHARIQASDQVLDAGCGVGGTGFFLARHIGCRVHGISITPAHIERARQLREAQPELMALTGFSVRDFSRTGFPDNAFDVVIGIESVVHATPKSAFLKEAFRVLKPGGRLVIADYFCRDLRSDDEARTLRRWGECWAIKDFIHEKSFCADATQAGFGTVALRDIADQALPSVKLMHRSYYPGIVISRLLYWLGRRTQAQVINSRSGKYQFDAYRQGVWRYKFFLAVKPPVDAAWRTPEHAAAPAPAVKPFVDELSFRQRFPIVSRAGFSWRNLLKRVMHFYLETGIRNPRRWF